MRRLDPHRPRIERAAVVLAPCFTPLIIVRTHPVLPSVAPPARRCDPVRAAGDGAGLQIDPRWGGGRADTSLTSPSPKIHPPLPNQFSHAEHPSTSTGAAARQ